MKPEKPLNYTIIEELKERYSGRAFSVEPVTDEELGSVFEAARWAPSAYNEQPWSFILGKKGSSVYKKILNTLMDSNRHWSENAPVLAVAIARKLFSHNNKPNRHYLYDTGQAVAHLSVQATALGINVHQMGGFDREKLENELQIITPQEAVTVIALGKRGDAEQLSEDLKTRELSRQQRKPVSEFLSCD